MSKIELFAKIVTLLFCLYPNSKLTYVILMSNDVCLLSGLLRLITKYISSVTSSKEFFDRTGIDFLKWKWNRRRQPHLDIYKNPAGRIRRAFTMAVLAQRVIHHVRSDGHRGKGLQHRGKLHT